MYRFTSQRTGAAPEQLSTRTKHDSITQVAYSAYLAGLYIHLNGFATLVEIHANARRPAMAVFKLPFAIGAQLIHPSYRIAHHNQLVVDARRAAAAVGQHGAGDQYSQKKHQITHVTSSLPCRSILPECAAAGESCPRRSFRGRQKSCGKVLGGAGQREHLYATAPPVCPQTNPITKTTEKTDDSRHDNRSAGSAFSGTGGLPGGHPTGCIQRRGHV